MNVRPNEKDIYAELDYADALGVVAITVAILVACSLAVAVATWLLT